MADAITRAREVIEARLAELSDEAGRLEGVLEELRGGRRRRGSTANHPEARSRPAGGC